MCHDVGPGTLGSPCTDGNQCGSDMDCVADVGSLTMAHCLQICDAASHGCPAGTTCSITAFETGWCK